MVDPDGTGTITVTAEADAELVNEVPTIADELVLDDIAAAGWTIDGPNPTPTGGLILTLTHDFEGKDEATNLLRSLGPPFNDPVIGRGQDGDSATNTARANLGLPDGFATFADDDLVSAVGDIPFASRFEAAGANPVNSVNATLLPHAARRTRRRRNQRRGARRRSPPVDDPDGRHDPRSLGAQRAGPLGRRGLGPTGRHRRTDRADRVGCVHDPLHRLRDRRPLAQRARRYRRRALP